MVRSSWLIGGVILGLFILVAYPNLAAIEQQSADARCLQNLRALSLAFNHYAADHRDELPGAVDRSVRPWEWWYDAIFPYVHDPSVFYCPLKRESSPPSSPLLPVVWNPAMLSYGLNQSLDVAQKAKPGLTQHDIADPERKILLGEANSQLLRIARASWPQDIAPRHAGHANVVFFSGRADSLAASAKAIPRSGGEGIENIAWWNLP